MKTFELYQQWGSLDLAIEAHQLLRGETGRELPGVKEKVESFDYGKVTTITITDSTGEQLMGRQKGTYITLEVPAIRENNRPLHKEIAEVMAAKLSSLVNLTPHASVLIVGLGNWRATPDALGPQVVEHVLVTRHLHRYAPEELREGMRPVSALAPGVLGIAGVETAEIVKGVVEKTQPDLVIVIDALAAANINRIGTTIQMADTGISPGSGLGQKRAALNKDYLGVPVIAIGVPTVVHAGTIARESITALVEALKENEVTASLYRNANPILIENIMGEVLAAYSGNLVVTPKEIDELIKNISLLLALGINRALHPAISEEEMALYVN
ncbi:MAG: spore protease [Eubacteriales bacterium]|nr:spore protease [Eubacteriales bacterium]